MKDTLNYPKSSLNLGGILTPFDVPLVMGIINATPDSFYENSRLTSVDAVLKVAEDMLASGVDIIDIGGYSSRPGASQVDENEEQRRVIPLIVAILKRFSQVKISVDTFRSKVADECLQHGAVMINDISAGNLDEKMFEIVAKNNASYCMMHMRGNPQTMMEDLTYVNLIQDILLYFSNKINQLKALGVTNIILDPGFGFSKSTQQNFELLNNLGQLKVLNLPLLVGLSRKSMIYKTLEIDAVKSLNGTTVLNTIALQQGASILRVHDVTEAKEAIKLLEAIKQSS